MRTHQRLLELAGHARLGMEGNFGAVQVLEQVLLDRGDVADALAIIRVSSWSRV